MKNIFKCFIITMIGVLISLDVYAEATSAAKLTVNLMPNIHTYWVIKDKPICKAGDYSRKPSCEYKDAGPISCTVYPTASNINMNMSYNLTFSYADKKTGETLNKILVLVSCRRKMSGWIIKTPTVTSCTVTVLRKPSSGKNCPQLLYDKTKSSSKTVNVIDPDVICPECDRCK